MKVSTIIYIFLGSVIVVTYFQYVYNKLVQMISNTIEVETKSFIVS